MTSKANQSHPNKPDPSTPRPKSGTTSPSETSDGSNSDISLSSDQRRLIHRSSLICSSGSDKFTFDSRGDPDDAGTPRHRTPVPSGADTPSPVGPTIKRNALVHPGHVDLQRSVFENGRFQNPWPTWRPPSITNIFKFGLSQDNSKVPSKQVCQHVGERTMYNAFSTNMSPNISCCSCFAIGFRLEFQIKLIRDSFVRKQW